MYVLDVTLSSQASEVTGTEIIADMVNVIFCNKTRLQI